MNVDAQAEALLALVEDDRARKCGAIEREARSAADAIVREAHAAARARVRAAFGEERTRAAARVAAAHANLDTRRRAAAHALAASLLDAAWTRLPAAMDARWRDPAARAAWVRGAVADARARLPHGEWRIVHAPGWPASEREAIAAELSRSAGATARFVEDASLGSGLSIAAGGNVVDGTRAGLLADRDEVGALLLDALERGAGSLR